MSDLTGKRVIVTGGAMGIGLGIARHLAGAGCGSWLRISIVIVPRPPPRRSGPGHRFVQVDVTQRSSVAAAFGSVEAAWGGYDLLVANAGVSTMARAVDLTDEEWDFNFAVNAKGIFLTNQCAVRHFLAGGTRGAIVNTASLAGKVGAPLLAHYSASKFAVVGWTQRWRGRWRRTASA